MLELLKVKVPVDFSARRVSRYAGRDITYLLTLFPMRRSDL